MRACKSKIVHEELYGKNLYMYNLMARFTISNKERKERNFYEHFFMKMSSSITFKVMIRYLKKI